MSQSGKAKIKEVLRNQNLTQDTLKNLLGVSLDIVKRVLGTKDDFDGFDRHLVKKIAKV